MKGKQLDLGNGITLCWGYVEQRKSPFFGVQSGSVLNVLGYFSGQRELDFFTEKIEAAVENNPVWALPR